MAAISSLATSIATQISDILQDPFHPTQMRASAGGSINATYCLSDGSRSYFVKCNQASQLQMFVAEAEGLQELAQAKAVRIPKPICSGVADGTSYLVLEYLDLGTERGNTAALLGQQLAQMHGHMAPQFGWRRDNTIGSTPQHNPWSNDWVEFYRQHRLGYQLRLARRFDGLQEGEILVRRLDEFFQSYRPRPSLLHGDLWSGNYGATTSGDPVLFDPAVYYGDRESDLAMTELFGRFPDPFYAAYQQTYPLDPGYSARKPLYQLYHLLNHLNLFGGSYLGSVQKSIRQCLQHLQP